MSRSVAPRAISSDVLIVGSGINFIDLAGAEALIAENRSLVKQRGGLYFVGLKPSVYKFAAKSHMVREIGPDHFFDRKSEAVKHIFKKLDHAECVACQAQIFSECP